MQALKKKASNHGNLLRREFLRRSGTGAAAAALGAMGFPAILASKPKFRSAIVLGIDGMDPGLTLKFLQDGRLPHCQRLMEAGSFRRLGTSDPPQSPVAWSNFISGTNPGGHGVFDFIARDPATLKPHFSISRAEASKWTFNVADRRLPLFEGKVENLRRGPTFWNNLQNEGIDCIISCIPANFPPTESRAQTLSGLGTPDLHGSYGIFSYYTNDGAFPGLKGEQQREVAGGSLARVQVRDGVVRNALRGPANTFTANLRHVDVLFTVYLDPPQRMAKVVIQGNEFILKEGEWSHWVTLDFPMQTGLACVSGICRFYLQSVRDRFALYVSPININPADPALPICTPRSYSRSLVKALGLFHTLGIAEDTAALTERVFSDDEYREQASSVLRERLRQFNHELGRFRRGLLFFYFSSLDLNSHAFWRLVDRGHPLYSDESARRNGDFLPWLYEQMDKVVGEAMGRLDDETLLFVVSDHGFTSFRRRFHLNSWLLENGYAALRDVFSQGEVNLFEDVNWKETRAYGLGINSLYLNLKGREPEGTVSPGDEAGALKAELVERLKALEDPKTGEKVVANVYRAEDVYSGPYVGAAPDLVVGYNRNYRSSKETILGDFPERIIEDNDDPWSGDHCMDSALLPGVCFCNRKLAADQPTLADMAPTLFSAFGVPIPREMTGKNVLLA